MPCGVDSAVLQSLDGVSFRMARPFDFGFLAKFGKVFKVFDDQDSGNICFGVEGTDGRRFVKFAGAPTLRCPGSPQDAIARLTATIPIYKTIRHPSLIRYLGSEEIGGGFAMYFDWADGECMGRMYEASHKRVMALPNAEKLLIFQSVTGFFKAVAQQGYVAIDFYDGSILYDAPTHTTTICDIDFFRPAPTVNDMGRMWGSSRFLSPEEYEKGAVLDEITNVFTLGQTAFSLFTDSDRSPEAWPLPEECYHVLRKATDPVRARRYPTISALEDAWNQSVSKHFSVTYDALKASYIGGGENIEV